jgi:hypothetical protein
MPGGGSSDAQSDNQADKQSETGAEKQGAKHTKEFDKLLFKATRLVVLVGVGLCIAFAVAAADSVGEAFEIGAMAVGVALAAAVIGALLGFLFGVPRTLQHENKDDTGPQYLANTNLEQISDWLTKIIVGIGLIQVGHAREALASLAASLDQPLGGVPASAGFGLALAVYAVTAAFILAYLWARVSMHRYLKIADAQIVERVRGLQQDVESLKADREAERLVDVALSQDGPPTVDELARALHKASETTRLKTYRRAEEARVRSWRDAHGLPDHDRTIKVFEALIVNDKNREFHRHFGSLAFALKDRHKPDRERALENLTAAIGIRGDCDRREHALYEWNRAALLIWMLDRGDRAETPDVKKQVLGDLRTAARHIPEERFLDMADQATNEAVKVWLSKHKLNYEALHPR